MRDWFARFYDLIYADKDYSGEATRVTDLIKDRCPEAATLLDVACGTGRHLEYLRQTFACEGVDMSEAFLATAAARLGDIHLEQADMAELDLGRTFDAVVCLFSAIGYAESRERMFRAVAKMARHLNPGGVLLVEPWVQPEGWIEPGTTFVQTGEDDPAKIVRVSATHRQGDLSVLDMHYVWATPGKIETADERHILGLFTAEEYLDALARAGLRAEWDEHGLIGRGLAIGQSSRNQ